MTGGGRAPAVATAVLYSGGLDSAVLLAQEAERAVVLPMYVRTGLAWEAEERAAAERLLHHPRFAGRTQPMIDLSVPVADIYPATHWAVRGEPPGYDTPDEDVYLRWAQRAAAGQSRDSVGAVRHRPNRPRPAGR